MKSVMKRWAWAAVRLAITQWQRNMADADIIMLHHNMQYDAGIMLVKHQLNQLVSDRIKSVVHNWRRRQVETSLKQDYEAGQGPEQLATNKAKAENKLRNVLRRWQQSQKVRALQNWQKNLADSDIINMHHQMQWEAATRIMIGWLRRHSTRKSQLVIRMWGRNLLLDRIDQGGAPTSFGGHHKGVSTSMRLFNIMAEEAKTKKLERCMNSAMRRWRNHTQSTIKPCLAVWSAGAIRQRRLEMQELAQAASPRSKSPRNGTPLMTPRSRAHEALVSGRAKPGGLTAARGAIESASLATATASVDESIYWSMRDFEGGYSLFGSRRVFNFEDTSIRMVSFANNNQWLLAIVLANFTVHVAFVSESSAVIAATLTGHTAAVNDVSWSPDNEVLATASSDATIRFWNNPEFECTRIVDCGVPLTASVFHPTVPDVLAVATIKCMVELFNTKAARVTEQIEFAEPIRALTWNPQGKVLFMGDEKGKLNAYRYGGVNGQMVKVANMRAATRTITHLATTQHVTNPKACIVLVNSLSNMVQLCQFEEKKNGFGANDVFLTLLRKFPVSNSQHSLQADFCPTIARFPGSQNIVTGSEDGTVFVFNYEKKEEPWINQLLGHEAPVTSCAWSGDGSILITADAVGSVAIWLRDAAAE